MAKPYPAGYVVPQFLKFDSRMRKDCEHLIRFLDSLGLQLRLWLREFLQVTKHPLHLVRKTITWIHSWFATSCLFVQCNFRFLREVHFSWTPRNPLALQWRRWHVPEELFWTTSRFLRSNVWIDIANVCLHGIWRNTVYIWTTLCSPPSLG